MKRFIFKRVALTLFVFSSFANAENIQVLSATVKDKVLEGVSATLQRNGHTSLSATSNDKGELRFDQGATDSDSLLILKKAGYSTLVVKCPCDGMTYAMSSVMENLDGLRIVLNWGSRPEDLDSHIVYPNNHIYFENRMGDRSDLDVDDTDSYGPETITIEDKFDGQRYVYAVHDYTNRDFRSSDRLGKSRAQVMVYIGSTLIKTYYVDPSQKGTLWVVFGVDENGEFHDINQYTNAQSYTLTGNYLKEVMNLTDMSKPLSTNVDDIAQAKRLNVQGEKLYHQGKYSDAIAYFQEAIELWGEFGQAYSNLGLTFKQDNRIAEAIWANRKAIALADGKNKDTIQASSYYNIAKIYESQGLWAKAKHSFELALSKRQHDAYVSGIQRMNEKLN
jgi:hypothetical protein